MKNTHMGGPPVLDYSEGAAKRAALSETVQHPFTLWPAALGVTGAFAAFLFSLPVWVFITSLGGVAIGAGHLAFKFFGQQDVFVQQYFAHLHEEFENLKATRMHELAPELKRLGCKRGSQQVSQFEEKFENLRLVLSRILSEGEMTYTRFLATAETVFKSGIENLDRIITILTNLSDTDREGLRREIDEFENNKRRTGAEDRMLAALKERAKLYDDGQDEVANLLASNEEALTEIDKAGIAVGRIKTSSANSDLESAMGDLISLIRRTNVRNDAKSSGLAV